MASYFEYYLLSYFSIDQVVTISQIYHIFQGKRTPSMFYLTEIKHKHHGFSQFRNISKDEIENRINHLAHKNWLIKKDKGYILTDIGRDKLKKYFQTHYYPQKITTFSNINLRSLFWKRYQLYTQVFSEYSNENTKYSPVIKHPSHQENVRQLFYVFKEEKNILLLKWINENKFIFSKMNKKSTEILANFLTGYKLVGNTRNQMAELLDIDRLELNFILMDAIEEFINAIRIYKEKVPLLYKILIITDEESLYGLSPSTFITYQSLNKGRKIEQIAKDRKIKENTIKEHILEISFTVQNFSYENYIPQAIYQDLQKMFRNNIPTFRDVSEKIEDVEFMHYRLVDLERLRSN